MSHISSTSEAVDGCQSCDEDICIGAHGYAALAVPNLHSLVDKVGVELDGVDEVNGRRVELCDRSRRRRSAP